MKKRLFSLLAATLTALILNGCGDSQDFTTSNSAVGGPNALSGTVANRDGNPLEGVRLVVMERTTSRQFQLLSGPNGAFNVNLDGGVYDVALDLEGDTQTATAFYGPIGINGSIRQNFTLPDTAGRSPNEVFGQILSESGLPVTGLQINLRPGFSTGDRGTLEPLATESGPNSADGSFSLILDSDSEVAMDVELLDSNSNLLEFVDIAKREGKPCFVQFVTGPNTTKNRLRCNESDEPTDFNASVLAQGGVQLFTLNLDEAGNDIDLEDGLLPVGSPQAKLPELTKSYTVNSDFDKLFGLFEATNIRVAKDGWLWYDYAVHIEPDRGSSWTFTDQTGDYYNLWVSAFRNSIGPGWHRVNYNSNSPDINNIQFGQANF